MARVSDNSPDDREAIDWLRQWAGLGCPRRIDGSFPADFITCMRRLMDVAPERVGYRLMENALCAGPDFDHVLPRSRQWSAADAADFQRRLS